MIKYPRTIAPIFCGVSWCSDHRAQRAAKHVSGGTP